MPIEMFKCKEDYFTSTPLNFPRARALCTLHLRAKKLVKTSRNISAAS